MHEYRDTPIAKLMLQVNSKTDDVDLYIATTMSRMAGIERGGRSLILGVGLSTFACGLGDSKTFGHEVLGVVFHANASALHQQNFWKGRSRSRARFVLSTTDALNLAVPIPYWDYVLALPNVVWEEVESFALNRVQEDAKIMAAQKMPTDVSLEDFEHEFFRVTGRGYCHMTEDVESAKYVVFKVR